MPDAIHYYLFKNFNSNINIENFSNKQTMNPTYEYKKFLYCYYVHLII